MDVVALGNAKLLVLMVAGGIFALAGLWLMFRPKPEGGAAKLELLGMKFESSSAGLLVFLIGSGFLATPLIVPERITPAPAPAPAPAPGPPGSPVAASTSGAGMIPPRVRASGKEREPNNDQDAANQIAVGDSIAGEVDSYSDSSAGDDWFVMPIDAAAPRLYVKIRNGGGVCSYARFYTLEETEIGAWAGPGDQTAELIEVPLPTTEAVFMRLTGWCSYEFFTSYDPIE